MIDPTCPRPPTLHGDSVVFAGDPGPRRASSDTRIGQRPSAGRSKPATPCLSR